MNSGKYYHPPLEPYCSFYITLQYTYDHAVSAGFF